MKPREVFGVAIRTIGLLIMLYDIFLILVVILKAVGFAVTTQQTNAVDAMVAILYFVVACGLLFGAKHIEDAVYGRSNSN